MTTDELLVRRLSGQHLLTPCGAESAVSNLCGIQAQFFSNALHALRIRCGHEPQPEELAPLLKTWTLRGTLHLICERDLPLFLHENRSRFLRPCDTMEADEALSAERKQFFAALIAREIASGVRERDALREACRAAGMTEAEAASAFNAWGGLIRAMCESGTIAHQPQQKKAFRLCPDFMPMPRDEARLELLRRYFTHYGPASLRDAAYFFGVPQREIAPLLELLPLAHETCNGRVYYSLGARTDTSDMPECVFLAGFDPLMMGYEKTENPFLPQQALRGIFNRAGIVMAPILLHGRVVGRWKRTGHKALLMLFESPSPADMQTLRQTAEALFGGGTVCAFESLR